MNNCLISDYELVKQYLDGNENSLERLIFRYKDRVFSSIMLIVRDEELANDIFQDTFIKVINTLKKGKYNDEGKFLPWVMRIAHNLCIDYFRVAKKVPVVSNNVDEEFDIFDTIGICDENVEDKMINEQILQDVKKLTELLPEEQKDIIFMRFYADMSFKEIAEQYNISINTALGRMRYALINLRKLIKEKNVILSV